jgi:hypothetical protein
MHVKIENRTMFSSESNFNQLNLNFKQQSFRIHHPLLHQNLIHTVDIVSAKDEHRNITISKRISFEIEFGKVEIP